jgi:hypothetical protein
MAASNFRSVPVRGCVTFTFFAIAFAIAFIVWF